MEKAVIYARYSSHSQSEQSIEGQIAAAQKYALDHNYQIVGAYCDRAKTGTNDNRDEFQRMLSDTSKHVFTVIIVWKVDRFGRNREEIAFNKHHCKKNGVRIEYVAENIAEGPEGVILESVLEGMAEYYSLQLSQNIKRGRLESAKKFKCISGRVPLGFAITHDRKYELDPDQALIVRQIFEHIAAGESLTEVTNWLNAEHCLTSQGNPFTKNSLPRILNNEIYLGIYKYKDLIREENAVPAIIDRELWNKAHEKLQDRQRQPVKAWTYSDYLLSGKLFCGDCGASMIGISGTGKLGKKYNYYMCVNSRSKNNCSRRAVRSDLIESKIIDFIQKGVLTQPNIERMATIVYEYYRKDIKTNRTNRLSKQLNEHITARNNLFKAIESGLEYNVVKQRLEDLNGQINTLEEKLSMEKLSKPLELTKEQIIHFLSQFTKLDYSYRKYQRKMINTFVNSITVYEKELVVALNYSSDGKPFTCSTACTQVELSKRESNPVVRDNVMLFKIEI